ncbi:MAG: tetratricopeptide repeat protein, partial [Armatimonadota bacterium]|nr:tetratricopeptide repeat protein [Armatimonadota bacterium]
MHCHECGTSNTLDSKYCKECGAKINDGYRTMMLSVQDIESLQSEDEQGRLAKFLDMAFWHNEAGNIDAAIRASESALAINPKSTTAHSLLGTLYEKKGEDAQAIQHFETVLTLNPDSAADAAKLAQIRSGVHVRAVPAPAAQRWLPPAVVALGPTLKDKWGTLLSSDQEQPLTFKRKPLYAAGAAGAAVLVIGLLALRPASSVQSASKVIVTPPLAQSAFAPRAVPGVDATTTTTAPPFVLPPGVGGSVPLSSTFTAPNPFRETPAPRAAAPSLPDYDLPPTRARNRRRSARRGDSSSLPPLTLNALPLPDQDQIAPAPVSVPATATVAAIPQHTVVVSSLPGSPPPSANASYNPGWNNGPAPVAPHIHISLSQGKSSEEAAPASDDSSSGEGESLQQSALSLQQQGEYRSALADYSRAIRAYKSQIASGHDVEA